MSRILDSGINSAAYNMEFDAQLLASLDSTEEAILHLYDWKRQSLTYGYFIKPSTFLDLDAVEKYELDIARRPTGGGLIFHSFDFAFSILLPSNHPLFSLNTLDNYHTINQHVFQAIKRVLDKDYSLSLLEVTPVPLDSASKNFCMANPTIYDLMIGDKKIGGAAQRRIKSGLLHQSSIAISLPSQEYLERFLFKNNRVAEAMQMNSFALLPRKSSLSQVEEMKQLLKSHLIQEFQKSF